MRSWFRGANRQPSAQQADFATHGQSSEGRTTTHYPSGDEEVAPPSLWTVVTRIRASA